MKERGNEIVGDAAGGQMSVVRKGIRVLSFEVTIKK
jgi:hypothetical protein